MCSVEISVKILVRTENRLYRFVLFKGQRNKCNFIDFGIKPIKNQFDMAEEQKKIETESSKKSRTKVNRQNDFYAG